MEVYNDLLKQQMEIQRKQLDVLAQLATESAATQQQLKPLKQLLKLAEAGEVISHGQTFEFTQRK